MERSAKKQDLTDLKVPFQKQFEAQKKLLSHLVPILAVNDDSTVDLVGTGIYLSYHEKLFLLTANHVLGDRAIERHLLPQELGSFTTIEARSLIRGQDELADIAIFELVATLPGSDPIDVSKIEEPSSNQNPFHLIGYPASKVDRKTEGLILFSYYSVITSPIEGGDKYFETFSQQLHLTFDFRKKNIRLGNNKLGTFPDPYGMSGGGAFELFFSENSDFLGYSLVGIMSGWNYVQKRFIKCTRASLVKDLIEGSFSQLRTDLSFKEKQGLKNESTVF